jgi:hypothetical protein
VVVVVMGAGEKKKAYVHRQELAAKSRGATIWRCLFFITDGKYRVKILLLMKSNKIYNILIIVSFREKMIKN